MNKRRQVNAPSSFTTHQAILRNMISRVSSNVASEELDLCLKYSLYFHRAIYA